MPLPPVRSAAVAGSASLSVLDYRTTSVTTDPAGADGTMTAEFEPVPSGLFWLVQRVTVLSTSNVPTRAMMYAGAPSPQNFLDGTDRGNLDTADNNSPILLDSNLPLTVQWSGASLGAQGSVRVQYQLVSRS